MTSFSIRRDITPTLISSFQMVFNPMNLWMGSRIFINRAASNWCVLQNFHRSVDKYNRVWTRPECMTGIWHQKHARISRPLLKFRRTFIGRYFWKFSKDVHCRLRSESVSLLHPSRLYFSCVLKFTGQELDLFTIIKMFFFIENAIRGWISL